MSGEKWRERVRQQQEAIRARRLERGLLPDGGEPIDLEDFLVEVWRLQAAGREDDARRLLAGVWSWGMDGVAHPRDVRLGLRLLERLGFVSDDAEGWAALPDEVVVFRAESDEVDEPSSGLAWTLERGVAEMHAERHGLAIRSGTISKQDALAYIAGYGESEIVIRRNAVRDSHVVQTSVQSSSAEELD